MAKKGKLVIKTFTIDMDERTGKAGRESLPVRISALAGYAKRFKIGITNDPEGRASEYTRKYSRMVVLFKTSSLTRIRNVERQMVDRYIDHPKNDNKVGGGGGDYGDSPYFLYVVLKY